MMHPGAKIWCMGRHFLSTLLVLGAFVFVGTSSSNAQTYTFDGRTVQRWQGDPNTLKVAEWQIWLYKRGQTTGGGDHWGSVSASSAAKAEAQLLGGQAFEVSYCKFFGHPSDCEKNMTYFNPFGPIAIMKADKTVSQRIVIDLWSIKEAKDRLKKLMDLYSGLQAAYNPYSYQGVPGQANPFAGVGAFVMDYGASLKAAVDKLKLASEQLNSLNETNERTLDSSLDEFDGVANSQNDRVSALETDSGEIQSRYNTLSKEGVLKPTVNSSGSTWMHTVYDDGDGDQIKKISIDAIIHSDGIVMRQINTRADSTETVDTKLSFAGIAYASMMTDWTNNHVVTETESEHNLTFGLAHDESYTVKIIGKSANPFTVHSVLKNGAGQSQPNDSTTTRYLFTFNDEASAKACQDFINSHISH
jgi:hypothetical protein